MNETLFTEMVELHTDAIYRFCVLYVKNHHDAQDCTQDTFIKLYKQKIDNRDHIKNWLYVVARRECLQLLRFSWRKTIIDDDLIAQFSMHENKDDFSLILSCPQKYREVLYLYYYEDYSQAEIAQLLNLSIDAVKKRMVRGRDYLKETLEGVETHEG
ncbi:RNA polymerase sigma factor [Erysipelothrix sp. HDW6C]|uniref:RNA polymerase sigma factor n=1 Tax=Erysipelothrix sp. HDW6C TaxID=2714930 RepID=UPI001409EDB8|nr:RNA polymerase sigma factor [Erysipelothrix sp. HDW6C]QIK69694.1 RNA polymerase sigma factor [Erysipelothrix sp. HDW6C]